MEVEQGGETRIRTGRLRIGTNRHAAKPIPLETTLAAMSGENKPQLLDG